MKLRNKRNNILTIEESDSLMGEYFRYNRPQCRCKVPATDYEVIDKRGTLVLIAAWINSRRWFTSGKHSYHLAGNAARTLRQFMKGQIK